ncbi:hypothetical protein Tco_0736173 [Tanacetum coccineum]
MAFLTAVASSRLPSTNNQLRTSSNLRNQATIQDDKVIVQQVQGRQGQSYAGTGYKGNATSSRGNNAGGQARVVKCYNYQDPGIPDCQAAQTTIPNTDAFQTEDLDAYDSDSDDVSNAKAVLMANLFNYGSDVISKVLHSEFYQNDLDNQKTQQAAVQDTNLYAQQDSMILSVIEQMSEQMINHVNNWEKANQEKNNESLTAELERYKERVKTFEQRLNIDLSTREKMIDSQMDDMIKEKLALKQQIDSLEQNLSNQIKEKESLLQTFTVFKNESKEKESKYMDKEIDLEKKIKELDNIVYKVGQSAQTVHMLTKPQVFYDDTHKQALGYQNPFYLKKAQRIKPTLYDGSVISSQHAVIPVIDDEETLILEEVSRSKMLAKQNDPISKEKKINTTPINYVELNQLSEDFGKRFVPQQELSAEQAFWLQTSNPNTEQSDISPVRIEAPSELPKVSFVNTSLKKLKFYLSIFDTVVKKWNTPDAITEGEWGFENTKADILLNVMNSATVHSDSINLVMQSSESCDKCFDLDVELLKKQNAYTALLKIYSQLENIVFLLNFDFENNELKAQLQAKDTTICKLKEHIKSLKENVKKDKVKQDMDETETINIELEHSVAKLLSENKLLHKEIEHLKKIYKDQFDLIKKTRACFKEHNDSLIAQLNSKSMENADLKSQIQEKVFVTTALQNELRRLKARYEPISHSLKNNRDAHEDNLKKTIENTDTIRGLVERTRKQNPSEPLLDSACMFTKHVQELLVYVSKTCPSLTKPSEKLVAVIPINKVKKVRFSKPLTSSNNIHKHVESSKASDSNTLVLPSTGLKSSTSASRSQPTGNKKNDRISQTPSSNMKNKV